MRKTLLIHKKINNLNQLKSYKRIIKVAIIVIAYVVTKTITIRSSISLKIIFPTILDIKKIMRVFKIIYKLIKLIMMMMTTTKVATANHVFLMNKVN
jgi:hypothetical protein